MNMEKFKTSIVEDLLPGKKKETEEEYKEREAEAIKNNVKIAKDLERTINDAMSGGGEYYLIGGDKKENLKSVARGITSEDERAILNLANFKRNKLEGKVGKLRNEKPRGRPVDVEDITGKSLLPENEKRYFETGYGELVDIFKELKENKGDVMSPLNKLRGKLSSLVEFGEKEMEELEEKE